MNLSKNNTNLYSWSVQLMVWLVLFSVPYLFSASESIELNKLAEHFWLPLLYSAIIFYVNTLFLIDYFLFGKKVQITKYVLANVMLILIFFTFHFELKQLIFYQVPPEFFTSDGKLIKRPGPPVRLFIYKDFISLIIPVIFSIAVKSTERLVKNNAEKEEAEKQKLIAELKELKYQLQPHFFFNSMNNIYSLVDVAPEKAKETLHTLSKLMRYMLYETESEKVDLTKEIEFLNKYIDLMRLRLPEKVKINVDFPQTFTPVKVAPLLFISLVENAFKHGVSASLDSEISFEMHVEGGLIYFVSRNTNFTKKEEDMSGSGIGLENLKKRLSLVYPDKYSFDTNIQDNVYFARLTIDI